MTRHNMEDWVGRQQRKARKIIYASKWLKKQKLEATRKLGTGNEYETLKTY